MVQREEEFEPGISKLNNFVILVTPSLLRSVTGWISLSAKGLPRMGGSKLMFMQLLKVVLQQQLCSKIGKETLFGWNPIYSLAPRLSWQKLRP